MSALGGIGQQVAGDLFELGKGVVKGTVKAVTDISTDSIEQILSAPAGFIKSDIVNDKGKKNENEEQTRLLKRSKERRQFNEVKNRLEEYVERRKSLEAQIAREKAQQKQEEDQKKGIEKQKKESFLQQLMGRLAKGSHGETDRQKE